MTRDEMLLRADDCFRSARETADVDRQEVLLFISDGLRAVASTGELQAATPAYLEAGRTSDTDSPAAGSSLPR